MTVSRFGLSPESPLVSILVVVFKDRTELDSVLNSILPKKTEDVELIVIDGGSDDGSVELLQEYNSQIDYWVSEPDRGIYDAMNKGIAAAHGRFLYHLNAGDRLIYLPIRELQRADAENADVVSFAVSLDGKREFHPVVGMLLKLTNTLHHQGTFYRRSKFPGYDLKYKVFADFDANQRLALQGVRFKLSDIVVASHGTGGASHQKQSASELFRVVDANYGIPYVMLSWLNCKLGGLRRRLERISARI